MITCTFARLLTLQRCAMRRTVSSWRRLLFSLAVGCGAGHCLDVAKHIDKEIQLADGVTFILQRFDGPTCIGLEERGYAQECYGHITAEELDTLIKALQELREGME